MTRWLLAALLLSLGCSNVVYVPVEGGEPAGSVAEIQAERLDRALHPTLGIDPDIADFALSAVTLWQDATGGLYAPEVHIGCTGDETFCIYQQPEMVTECVDDEGLFNGCCDADQHEIRLSEDMLLETKISTLAHELGHSLGLSHVPDGLMNPHRGYDERHAACIDQVTLDAFAARYGAADLQVTCYTSEIFSEMLALRSNMESGSEAR